MYYLKLNGKVGDVSVGLLHKVFTKFMGRITVCITVTVEILLMSPRKIFIFIINKTIYRIKVSKSENTVGPVIIEFRSY